MPILQRLDQDIYQCPRPEQIISHPENSTVTLGDLHGNAAKFLNMLTLEGM